MFLEFNVTNYRSIRDTQSLIATASKYYKGLEESNCFDAKVAGLPNLLRSAVIYGPNAAGKSNLLKALSFMQNFVLQSHAHQEGALINVAPFALASDTKGAPSEFEIFFIHDGIRYQFGFAVNRLRVTKEWLLSYPKGRPKRLYERAYDATTEEEQWDINLTGPKELWKKTTRKNALFLSTAIQLNNEQLKPVFNWFQSKLAMILPGADVSINFSIEQCATEEGTKRIMEFMKAADIGISGISVKNIPIPLSPEMLPPEMPQAIKDQFLKDFHGKEIPDVSFLHKTDNGDSVHFHISDESDGTQKLFTFAGPWLDVLSKGRILFIDEMDTSLHPLMVRFLIALFQDTKTNKHNAQLFFTTHDTSVLDTDIYRRDQVWFVEKSKDQSSRLYPLSDFSPRKGEALEKGYLQGRYGALPFIGELRF